jgi:hypothetical protein
MKVFILGAVLFGIIGVLALNPYLIANQIVDWAQQNPKADNVAEILFNTGRTCQFLTDGDTAIAVYNDLYTQFPDREDLCAPAMYYCGQIKMDSSYVKAIRVQALPFFQIVVDQYSDQTDWYKKAQQGILEVNK